MNHYRGFAGIAILLVVFGIVALGGAGYVAMNPQVLQRLSGGSAEGVGMQTEPGDSPEADRGADGMTIGATESIEWRFTSAGEVDAIPYTSVSVVVDGTAYDMGKFAGSCSEVGASGGVDGKGLLIGELSAAQCWFAGGGDEIGVFAHEDGGYDIMVGGLSEGDAETPLFRGDFSIKTSIEL